MKFVSFLMAISAAVMFGFFIGVSFPVALMPKLQCDSSVFGRLWEPIRNTTASSNATSEIVKVVARNPKGAERLPPGIVVPESDLHPRRLWGSPAEVLISLTLKNSSHCIDSPTCKYLLALTIGYTEKVNVNATVHKFSDNFDVMLFHYDGHTTEWDEFEWSKQAIHISAKKQTKWWFAKRFLQPSIVAPYDYVFLWDEDLGVENFTAEAYIDIVNKHGLGISQPGLDVTKGKKLYDITVKRDGREMHKTDAGGKNCSDVHQRPCSGFVEVMAPVFSRDAWKCVWHMIQNDLVHGWGLDFNFWRCVDDPEEQIGIVDAQFVVHHGVPTLRGQGNGENQGSSAKVRTRQFEEMQAFYSRISNADKELANSTNTSSSPTLR